MERPLLCRRSLPSNRERDRRIQMTRQLLARPRARARRSRRSRRLPSPRPRPPTRASARRCRWRASSSSTASPCPPRRPARPRRKIVMTVPSGFGIDSFVPPPPGWHQVVQQTGSGDSAVVTKVTWTGGTHARPARTRCFSSSPSRRPPGPTPSRSSRPTPTARSSTGRALSPIGRAGAHDRGQELARRWRRLDGDDHRADLRRARTGGRTALRCSVSGSRSGDRELA